MRPWCCSSTAKSIRRYWVSPEWRPKSRTITNGYVSCANSGFFPLNSRVRTSYLSYRIISDVCLVPVLVKIFCRWKINFCRSNCRLLYDSMFVGLLPLRFIDCKFSEQERMSTRTLTLVKWHFRIMFRSSDNCSLDKRFSRSKTISLGVLIIFYRTNSISKFF